MGKELDLPLIHRRVTQVNTTPGIIHLQFLPGRIFTVLCEINHRVTRYSSLIQSNLEWKAKTDHTILSFIVLNADNIPETLLTVPNHKTHVYIHIYKLTGPKSVTSRTELKAHYLKYIDEVLHPFTVPIHMQSTVMPLLITIE